MRSYVFFVLILMGWSTSAAGFSERSPPPPSPVPGCRSLGIAFIGEYRIKKRIDGEVRELKKRSDFGSTWSSHSDRYHEFYVMIPATARPQSGPLRVKVRPLHWTGPAAYPLKTYGIAAFDDDGFARVSGADFAELMPPPSGRPARIEFTIMAGETNLCRYELEVLKGD